MPGIIDNELPSLEFVMNGQKAGNTVARLMATGFETDAMRPFIGPRGYSYVNETVRNAYGEIERDGQGKPKVIAKRLNNVEAVLTRDAWMEIDQTILKIARPRLKFFSGLRSLGITRNIPGGLGKMVMEYQDMGDMTDAKMGMDPVAESENDRPEFSTKYFPLPVIYKDFSIHLRQLLASRNGGAPLDLTNAEMSARKVAEGVEKAALGVSSAFAYSDGTYYGATNFPQRNTKALTAPDGTNGPTTVLEVEDMLKKSRDDYFFGPWKLYASIDWAKWLDLDYSTDARGVITLRERLLKLDGLTGIETLDYLPAQTLLLLSQTSDTVRPVVGLDMTTVQWESHGGLMQHFKVMAMLLVQYRADQNGNCGIVHGSY